MRKPPSKLVFALLGFGLLIAMPIHAAPITQIDVAGLDARSSSTFDEVYVHLTRLPLSLRSVDVVISIDDASLRRQLGTRDLERLRSSFEEDLSTDNIGPNGTVHLEIRLTDLVPNAVLTHNGGRTARYHPSTGIGGASMEAIFSNAETGEVLMVIRDSRAGLGLDRNPHTFSRRIWGDASDILEDWADELPGAL